MSTGVELRSDNLAEDVQRESSGFISLNMWNLYARVYDFLPKYFKPYQKLMVDVISAVECSTPKGGRVLDSGCGTGNFSLGLGQRGYKVDGIDVSTAMLQRASLKRNKEGLANVVFREWDIEKGLPLYPDAIFDCVISVNALYTLRYPEAAISEYLRVLKPSGHFILVEPQSHIKVIPIAKEIYREGGLKDVFKLLVTQSGVGICNVLIGKKLRDGSYHYWGEEKLRNTLQHAGFRIDSVVSTYMAGLDLQATTVKPRCFFEMNRYRFLSAESREDLEKVLRLRYQVYCDESDLMPTNQSGLERDVYDEYAIHFLALDEKDMPVGTMRFVHTNPKGFSIDPDFPLTDYIQAHGISRAIEGGRFAIPKGLGRDARITVAFGMFKCLYDYCNETGIYDIFTATHHKVFQKYSMPGVRVIGEPFRYSKFLTGGLVVPVHCNIREAYQSYLNSVQDYARVS